MSHAIAQDLIDTISAMGTDATAASVIGSVEKRHPPAVVRETYWRLIAVNRIARSADAHLRVT